MTGSAQTARSFPKRSFARPSWMEEDMVDSAGTSESIFFSKVSPPAFILMGVGVRVG